MALTQPPFYLLNPVRSYILAHAAPITASNWPLIVTLPFLPLWPQAYLLCYPGTRPYRAAIAALGVALIAHTWSHYRFHEPYFDAFNNGLLIAAVHLSLKYIEFGMLAGPVVDAWPGRSTALRAFDLCANSRMIGLGSVGLDQSSGPRNAAAPAPERWLPRPRTGRARAQALGRHARRAAVGYVVLDTMLSLLRLTGADTLGRPGYAPDAIRAFSHAHKYTILPPVIDLAAPPWLVELVAEACVPVVIWGALNTGYHIFGALAMASMLYEVDAWEVDLMGDVWGADSILDLWGRRWHQLMSICFPFSSAGTAFLLLSAGTLSLLGLPQRPALTLPLIFLYSGLFHALGELGMSAPPSPPRIVAFFALSGAGAAAEALFRRATGRRVRGWTGRAWCWAFMFLSGRLACTAWFDAGMAGSHFLPHGGPGEWVARGLVGTLIGVDP